MTIIIEGVDRIGKTTLATELVKKYNCDYLHFTKEDPATFEFYLQTMRKTNVIYDRHFIGEMIYPAVFKRKPQLNQKDFERLLDHANDNNILVIILYTSDDSLLNKRMATEQYQEVKDQYHDINNSFYKFARVYQNHIISFDVSKITLKEMVNKIDKFSL